MSHYTEVDYTEDFCDSEECNITEEHYHCQRCGNTVLKTNMACKQCYPGKAYTCSDSKCETIIVISEEDYDENCLYCKDCKKKEEVKFKRCYNCGPKTNRIWVFNKFVCYCDA